MTFNVETLNRIGQLLELTASMIDHVAMLTKERHGEHKSLTEKNINSSYRNKIQVNLVKQ